MELFAVVGIVIMLLTLLLFTGLTYTLIVAMFVND